MKLLITFLFVVTGYLSNPISVNACDQDINCLLDVGFIGGFGIFSLFFLLGLILIGSKLFNTYKYINKNKLFKAFKFLVLLSFTILVAALLGEVAPLWLLDLFSEIVFNVSRIALVVIWPIWLIFCLRQIHLIKRNKINKPSLYSNIFTSLAITILIFSIFYINTTNSNILCLTTLKRLPPI